MINNVNIFTMYESLLQKRHKNFIDDLLKNKTKVPGKSIKLQAMSSRFNYKER